MNFEMQLYPLGRWAGLEDMAVASHAAERLGFEAVLVPSHVATPPGAQIDQIGDVWPDNIVIASYLIARTTTLRIHLAALIVPYFRPIVMARQLATMDQASAGRVDVTIGAGWFREEFDALQVSYPDRGAITDEYIAAMRALWTQERPSYSGTHVSFPELIFKPSCVQKPHIPLWIGGGGPPARRRVAEYGAGWTMLTGSLAEIGEEIKAMKEAVAAHGRDPDQLRFGYHFAYGKPDPAHDTAASHASDSDQSALVGRTPQEALEVLGRCAEAGLTHMELTTDWRNSDELIEVMTDFSEAVMPHIPGARADLSTSASN
jgi:probable F420-dependent oxidoreductase